MTRSHRVISASIKPKQISIPYKKFTLKNGLTLIVHEDRKAPIVAVNIWYHVGSKNEKQGKTGFAHLFEHLMFNGSEHFNDDYFQAMERIGATDLNGTTDEDRTNYFQNVPTSAIDVALWMESDRMGYLLGALDQKKLDEQRGVVQNEKRQSENEPYGMIDELITKSTWPTGHPYSWTVIGSMDDINAATLEDVKEWFKTYYGAANAVLVIAGDIDSKTALLKVEQYFGDVPSGPPLAKQEVWIAKRSGSQRQYYQDRVPQAKIYKVWNTPQWGTKESTFLNLAASILTTGKTSRLYKRLVYDEQIATSVGASQESREIAGQFVISATAKPQMAIEQIENAMTEELTRFLKNGPTNAELERAKTRYLAGFIRGVERIGGFGGKSDILAKCQVLMNDPEFYRRNLEYYKSATKTDIRNAINEWLSDGDYTLEVHPFPQYSITASNIDRAALPVPGSFPEVRFPTLERATLSNGLRIVFARRTAVPVVHFQLLMDAGCASDQLAIAGTSSLAMAMHDEGTKKRTALQISDELASLGATVSTSSGLDSSYFFLNTLKINLQKSLNIFIDILLHPTFPPKNFKRLQQLQIATIQREKVTPIQMALRVFPKLIYGSNHSYGNPMTGTGTEDSVKKITRNDLFKFHQNWIKPNNATIVVVGDTTMKEILSKLEHLLLGWKMGEIPKKDISFVTHQPQSKIYIMDRPDSISSIIFGGHIAPPTNNPDEIAIEALNEILGGSFTSRVNMNLREDKHWSYGAFTFFSNARGQRPFVAYSTVQEDKTKESLLEILKEIQDIRGNKPITEAELEKAKNRLTRELPGSWETIGSVGATIGTLIQYGFPDDYYITYPNKVMALKVDYLMEVAKRIIEPEKMVWVVVGDRFKIEKPLRELSFGEIGFLDGDGNVLG